MTEKNYYPIIENIYHNANGSLQFTMSAHSPEGILLDKSDDYKIFGKQWASLHPLNNWEDQSHFIFKMKHWKNKKICSKYFIR